MHKDDAKPNPAAARPHVPYVKVLDSDNLAECPADQYHLVQVMADLDYSRDHKGGSVVRLPVRLGYCPVCKTWYIDHLRLASLARQGVDLRCIDLIGSASYPRSIAYQAWHPLPVPPEPAERQAVPKTAGNRSTGGKSATRPARAAAGPAKSGSARAADLNLAFSCLYCDGGQSGRGIGYRGVCSQDGYFGNITRNPDAWCGNSGNRCREIRPDEEPTGEGLCYECRLLIDWAVVQPDVRLAVSHVGGVAVATTVLPRESEAYRRVVAVFAIAGQTGGPEGTRFVADNRLRFDLSSDEPVYFWKALTAKGQADPDWDGNCRSVSQSGIVRILHRSARVIKSAERRAVAEKMLELASARFSAAQLEKILG